MGRLGREAEFATYLNKLRAAHKAKRNFYEAAGSRAVLGSKRGLAPKAIDQLAIGVTNEVS
jgi:hypothetical protein